MTLLVGGAEGTGIVTTARAWRKEIAENAMIMGKFNSKLGHLFFKNSFKLQDTNLRFHANQIIQHRDKLLLNSFH